MKKFINASFMNFFYEFFDERNISFKSLISLINFKKKKTKKDKTKQTKKQIYSSFIIHPFCHQQIKRTILQFIQDL